LYLSPILKDQSGLVHAYSDATDGNMDLRFGEPAVTLTARRKFLGSLGLSLEECAQQQGLEAAIHVVKRSDLGSGMTDVQSRIPANAFVTDQPGIGLFLCIADCLPIILFDPEQRVIALVHAARESTNRKLSEQVVRRLEADFGCRPNSVLVSFGPAVRAKSYVFDDGIHNLVGPEWKPYLNEVAIGRFEVDYVAYNYDQLLQAGISPDHIFDPGIDTGSDPAYFSHVQSLKTGRPEARLAAVVCLQH
jgi:copper oxidase (laccase) domain-containing protein